MIAPLSIKAAQEIGNNKAISQNPIGSLNGRTYKVQSSTSDWKFSLLQKIILITAVLAIPLSLLFIHFGIRFSVYIVDRCFIEP